MIVHIDKFFDCYTICFSDSNVYNELNRLFYPSLSVYIKKDEIIISNFRKFLNPQTKAPKEVLSFKKRLEKMKLKKRLEYVHNHMLSLKALNKFNL